MCLNHPKTILPPTQSVEKLSSKKPVPRDKNVGDRCSTGMPHPPRPKLNVSSSLKLVSPPNMPISKVRLRQKQPQSLGVICSCAPWTPQTQTLNTSHC